MMPGDILSELLTYRAAGKPAALATVVETWGSAPQPVGAHLAVAADGQFAGSISGGCVEADVITGALDSLDDGQCRLMEFGVSDASAFAAGLACGGTIKVLVEPLDTGSGPASTDIEYLLSARRSRTPVAYQVDLENWTRTLKTDAPLPATGIDGTTFTLSLLPALRVVIIGAVHITQHLAPLLRSLGHESVIIDPRAAFATAERFPGERLINAWPEAALEEVEIDSRTAVITLTHNADFDDEALLGVLDSPACYIGCLGSRRTHAKRVERLRAAGRTQDEIARIYAPVGLDIGAKSAAEIALSIAAELTAIRHSKRASHGV